MNKELKNLLKKFSKEEAERIIESVMSVNSSKALIEKVKEYGIDLFEDEAEELFQLLKKPVELNDIDLALVAGGSESGNAENSNSNNKNQSSK